MAEIVGRLEEYYEAAGLADYYERVLSKMHEFELFKYYVETFYQQESMDWAEEEDPDWPAKRDAEFAVMLEEVKAV